ncbi:MAG TPA: hypothetical protein VGJ09_17540 [Bryobacteraceae bacterium]|jgi:hypothetical protein
MNLIKMIAELREQKQALDETIAIMERLARGQGKRRGRPPLFLSETGESVTPAGKTRKRRPFSSATRKKMAAAQRRRWAAVRKKAS